MCQHTCLKNFIQYITTRLLHNSANTHKGTTEQPRGQNSFKKDLRFF